MIKTVVRFVASFLWSMCVLVWIIATLVHLSPSPKVDIVHETYLLCMIIIGMLVTGRIIDGIPKN